MTLAAYQVSATIWTFLVFALDALAIAAQALTGYALGAADVARARALTRLMVRWGVWCGAGWACSCWRCTRCCRCCSPTDPFVQRALAAALVVRGGAAAAVRVRVRAGRRADRRRRRAVAGGGLAGAARAVPAGRGARARGGVTTSGLWWGFGVFMLTRGLLLGWRARGDTWAVAGAAR